MAKQEPIVRFKDVGFTYPGNSIETLKHVNLSIERGEFVIITGGNSSGKTTVGKCINALVPYSSGGTFDGEVEVCGRNTIEMSTSELATHVGFIFSNPEDQLVTSTVRSELAFGLENLLLSKEEILGKIEWILEELDIKELEGSSVFNLSTGQMQLIAIAAFVIMEPEILILDDPLSHLNRKVGKTVLRTILGLHSKGTTIIWITQDVTEIFSFASRIVMMDGGEVAFDGTPGQFMLLDDPLKLSAILPQHVDLAHGLIASGADNELMSPSLDEMIAKLRGYFMRRDGS